LDFVKGQQAELEEALRPLEASLIAAQGQHGQHGQHQTPDAERERTFALAESLDAQLQRMGEDLREVIEHLNATSAKVSELTIVTKCGQMN